MRNVHALGALVLLTLAACGDATPAGGAGSSAPAAKGSSAPAAAAAPKAADKPVLEEVKNEAMGYTIKIPKGSTTSMSDANGGSYGFDTMVIMVGPTGVDLATADDVLRGVNVDGATIDKKAEGDTVMAVVTAPSSPIKVYAGPKGKKIAATCMAEPAHKDLAIEVCSSLRSTK